MRIFFINLKRNILPFSLLIFTLLLVVFSNSNILAVKTGINIWFNNLVPSLFPIFIAVELLNYTNIPSLIGKLFNKILSLRDFSCSSVIIICLFFIPLDSTI